MEQEKTQQGELKPLGEMWKKEKIRQRNGDEEYRKKEKKPLIDDDVQKENRTKGEKEKVRNRHSMRDSTRRKEERERERERMAQNDLKN